MSVIDAKGLDAPKTKTMASFLKSTEHTKGRILFLGQMGESEDTLIKSVSNLPKVYFGKALCTNGYDIANSNRIVVTEAAVEDLIKVLGELSNEAA